MIHTSIAPSNLARRAGLLPAHREQVHAVLVLEVDREVVVDVPPLGAGADLPAP